MNLEDTIAAISTPVGQSGIGIVRMSGSNALAITKKIFTPSRGNKVSWNSSFRMYHGWIIDPETGERIDEVLISIMRAPRTYTREDVVEINCHGGAVVLRKTLQICLRQGARLAEPGEFTRRAFINGRIDLSQAESVLDIVQAKTEKGLQLAVKGIQGELSHHIADLREELVNFLVSLESEIDFCEEDIQMISGEEKEKSLNTVIKKVNELLDEARNSRFYREGVKSVIVGKTNVGKSSLLNALLKKERAIVSEIPGTTRDTIEENITIKGFPVCIIDTAGLKTVKDSLEKEGVKRTHSSLQQADFLLIMVDGSSPLSEEDREVFDILRKIDKRSLLIINKIDLPQKINETQLKKLAPDLSPVKISATRGTNLETLKTEMGNVILNEINLNSNDIMINLRQKKCLEEAKKRVLGAKEGLRKGFSEEILALELREAIGELDKVTGQKLGEEVLDKIFENFCIGK